jgi:two-component system OmpR family sensor kinase
MYKKLLLKVNIIFFISMILLMGSFIVIYISGAEFNQSILLNEQEKINLKKNKDATILVVIGFFLLLCALYYMLVKSIKKIITLLDSRKLFLRTLMHELKTPIAKGRLVAELIENGTQKNDLIKNYTQLNNIIDEFAKTEQISSDNYELNIETFYIDEVIDEACNILQEAKEHIEIEQNSEYKIKADFNLLAIAFKNIIDNDIKYSYDKKVKIIIDKNKIILKNKSDQLQYPIEKYFTPYHNNRSKINQGLGLGLYLVKKILDMHNFQLQYQYINSMIVFTIVIPNE